MCFFAMGEVGFEMAPRLLTGVGVCTRDSGAEYELISGNVSGGGGWMLVIARRCFYELRRDNVRSASLAFDACSNGTVSIVDYVSVPREV